MESLVEKTGSISGKDCWSIRRNDSRGRSDSRDQRQPRDDEERWRKSSQSRDFQDRGRDRRDRQTEMENERAKAAANARRERRAAITEEGAAEIWGTSPKNIVE